MSDYSILCQSYGPSLYWDLAAHGATDQSGNGRNGSAGGGISIGGFSASPILGETLSTDFAGGWIDSTYTPYQVGSIRTFTVWAYQDTTGDEVLFSATSVADPWMGYLSGAPGTNMRFSTGGGSQDWAAASPGTGQWMFVCWVYNDSTKVAELFVNGATQGQKTLGGSWSGTNALQLRLGARSGGLAFDGRLAHMALFQDALTALQISTLYSYAINGAPTPPKPVQVRTLPPLRLHILATTPNGSTFRWGQDERRAENNFSGLTFSTTIPGGFETCDVTLPRQSNVNYQDLTRLSTVQVKGAGMRTAWEGRLEKTPRTNDLLARTISPELSGWQAHLDDDNEAREIYVDRDLTHWQGMSRAEKIRLMSTVSTLGDGATDVDTTSGIPCVTLTITGTGGAINFQTEGWYDAGIGCTIASMYYDYTSQSTLAAYNGFIFTSSDDQQTATSSSADLITGTNTAGTGTQAGTAYRWGALSFSASSPAEGDHVLMFRRLTVWGSHGLTKQGTAPNDGLFASDVIANALSRWAPKLSYTTGSSGSIQPTAFIIPQLEFRDPTTAGNIIKEAAKYELSDWAVWDNPSSSSPKPTFYLNPRGARGKNWRARVGPSKLTETGPQVDRVWNGVIVVYQDVDGTSKSAGPTGTLCDATDATLIDTDPLNPANLAGVKRYAILDMGMLSTSTVAIAVGAKFLSQAKLLDQSGSAQIVGHIADDKGMMYPAYAIRAGDSISFTDANDRSYRRVVHTSYDHDSRTNSIDLDAPPDGMDQLLSELSASLFLGNVPGGTSASSPG